MMFGYTLIKKSRIKELENLRVNALEKYFTELFTYYPRVETALRAEGVTVEQMKLHMHQWAADWLFYGDSEKWYEVYSDPPGSANPVSRP